MKQKYCIIFFCAIRPKPYQEKNRLERYKSIKKNRLERYKSRLLSYAIISHKTHTGGKEMMNRAELLRRKKELMEEYSREYDEMEHNLESGTTGDVYEFFCGTLGLIERRINETENQLRALD